MSDDPMACIRALTQPAPDAPTMQHKVCLACGETTEWSSDVLPPETCENCKRPWATAAAPQPAAAPTPKPRGRPKKVETPPPAAPLTATGEVAVTREAIEQRMAEFIRAKGINAVSVVEVGTGTVQTHGFTVWVEKDGARLPVYNFMEPAIDTPQSFKAELNDARKADFTISLDVVRVGSLSPELLNVTYGQVVASLRSRTEGTIQVMRGAKVRLGAKLASTGRVVWSVIGPISS